MFVDTLGDQLADVPLHTIGGQGVFVKEVQRAVLAGHADVAVHSAKDLPSTPADGLTIRAFTARRSAADALVGRSLADLPHGATVASGSVRRRAQLAQARPDLEFVELRGNIQTRLGKLPEGGALVMAVAALQILGLTERIAEELDVDVFVPAPGQGCVAAECRTDDERHAALLAAIDHAPTRAAVEAERAFLAELGSGCSLPVGAFADDGRITGFLADPAGRAGVAPRRAARRRRARRGPSPGRRAGCRAAALMDDHPLAGRRVVVTRPADQAAPLVELLERAGARPVVMPLTEVVDEPAALIELASCDPTSVRLGGRHLGQRRAPADGRARRTARRPAARPGTSGARRRGHADRLDPRRASLAPADQRAEGLLAELPPPARGTARCSSSRLPTPHRRW